MCVVRRVTAGALDLVHILCSSPFAVVAMLQADRNAVGTSLSSTPKFLILNLPFPRLEHFVLVVDMRRENGLFEQEWIQER